MATKGNGSKIKVSLIFLSFIFLGTLVFSSLKFWHHKNLFDEGEKEIVRRIDEEIDSNTENIFDRFTACRSEEFIKNKDYSEEIKSKKEKDNSSYEEEIKSTKDTFNKMRKEVSENAEGLSKEKVAEGLKELDEDEKNGIEAVTKMYKKADEQYKKELIESDLKYKKALDGNIQKGVKSFKYFISDNKTGDFDTNSSYGKGSIDEKFYWASNYAVKLSFENKSSVTIQEYGYQGVYRLARPKQKIMEHDVTLYLWVPKSSEMANGYVKDLIALNKGDRDWYTKYEYGAMVSAGLFVITMILLVVMRKKLGLNYRLYDKIPADLLIIILLIVSFSYIFKSGLFFINGMFMGKNFQCLNPSILIGWGAILGTIVVTYIQFIKEKSIEELFKKGVLAKCGEKIKSLLEVRDIVVKMSVVFAIICLEILLVGNSYFMFKKLWIIVPVIFIILDGALFFFLTKKLIYFNDILDGTEKITSGDLSLVLAENGKGNLSNLAHNINNMKLGLKNSLEKEMKSERMKSELITNVSHDLKTPLTSIINYVDLLKKETLTPDKANDYVEILDRKSKRLKGLVEDLFEASKAASGVMELNIEKIEITELVKQTLAEFEDKIKVSTLDFKVNLGDEKVYATGDGKRTYRVFANLVQNALKYSMKHSRVYIDLIQEYGTTEFIIKNMSSYEMNFKADEIAERFKRGDVSRNTEGSGLGLAIAKSIMELQGGELKLEIDGDLFKAIARFKE